MIESSEPSDLCDLNMQIFLYGVRAFLEYWQVVVLSKELLHQSLRAITVEFILPFGLVYLLEKISRFNMHFFNYYKEIFGCVNLQYS